LKRISGDRFGHDLEVGTQVTFDRYCQYTDATLACLGFINPRSKDSLLDVPFMPLSGLSRNIQRAADPTLRDPQGFVQEMLSSVPIASQQLPARIGRYGEEQQRQGSALRRGFAVPEIQGTVHDPIDAELNRLGVFLGTPSDRLAITLPDGSTAKQSRGMIEDVRRGRGELSRQALVSIINTPGYQRLPDWSKKRLVQQALGSASRRAGSAARAATLSGREDVFRRATEPLRAIGRRSLPQARE
jgi:hypothetical protein